MPVSASWLILRFLTLPSCLTPFPRFPLALAGPAQFALEPVRQVLHRDRRSREKVLPLVAARSVRLSKLLDSEGLLLLDLLRLRQLLALCHSLSPYSPNRPFGRPVRTHKTVSPKPPVQNFRNALTASVCFFDSFFPFASLPFFAAFLLFAILVLLVRRFGLPAGVLLQEPNSRAPSRSIVFGFGASDAL